jgi:hypothetical protein
MTQRSLHVITKIYYRSISCFAMVSWQMAPLAVLRFPTHSGPFCTMWFRQFTQNVTKTDHKDRSHPHSTEHDTQPIAYLISKQAVPYRTHGGTSCPGVSTPKIRSLAYSSMTNHITWRIPTASTIPNLAQTTASNLTTVTWHHDRSKANTLNTSQTKHHKDGKTYMTLKTAGLSITTNHKNLILKFESLGNQLMHAACVY